LASTSGEGSTFTVYLPAGGTLTTTPSTPAIDSQVRENPPLRLAPDPTDADATPGPTPVRFNSQDGTILRGLKVLVVDDDFRNLFAMTALFERCLAEVTVAESGAQAIASLESNPDIDLVLMDIMMPTMDGYVTMRTIRSFDRFKSLPIIAVTGKVMPGERQRCIDAGANDFVPKPVDTDQLIAVLRPWLPTPARSGP
jgi:CheY-like chemotaxis protein